MPESELPAPARQSPVRDDQAWPFPLVTGHLAHVRLRVWPTQGDTGPLVIATDLMLGSGLINGAEALCRAVFREFGEAAVVVRHFPAWSMTAADGEDSFEHLVMDAKGVSHPHRCTEQILRLLGSAVLGFPGDIPPAGVEVGAAVVLPQSAQMARVLAALLRLNDNRVIERRPDGWPTRHGPVTEPDLAPLSHLMLSTTALLRLANFLGEADVDEFDTADGAKRSRKLNKIVDVLQAQAEQLTVLADQVIAEQRQRQE